MKTMCAVLLMPMAVFAQDSGNRVTVPFSDAARPRLVQGSSINGCFTVEGYDGKDLVIEPRAESKGRSVPRTPRNAEGLKRIEPAGVGLSAEEENNTIRIRTAMNSGDVVVRVPFATSLKLDCTNGGDMKVERVTGDLDLQNVNGSVTATNVSGSIIAHSLNGRVLVTLDKATAGKPMSFSSLNGDIDVTLPPDIKGAVKMKTDHGDIYSDFDVLLKTDASPAVVEDGRAKGGKYRVKIDSTTTGTINGGGPDLNFKTFNGNIYIRKKK